MKGTIIDLKRLIGDERSDHSARRDLNRKPLRRAIFRYTEEPKKTQSRKSANKD